PIARKHRSSTPERDAGAINTGAQVTERSLRELTYEALMTVQELINDGALYRGEEHANAVMGFAALKAQYDRLSTVAAKSAFAWRHAPRHGSGFRNTAIGTLVSDLSEGMDLETAVRRFEGKVAPENYKRPKAIVTQRMVDDAMK